MLSLTQDAAALSENWLVRFEALLRDDEGVLACDLFHEDSHWRDLLALTWDITTLNGRNGILDRLQENAKRMSAANFSCAHDRTQPRRIERAGTVTIEAIFRFRTTVGNCSGLVRLTQDVSNAGPYKAWTLFTALDDLSGCDERGKQKQPPCGNCARDFHGPNWLDNRKKALAYADRDPAVIVVGAGQAGLSIAAHLTQLQVDTLVVDREDRIGDNWRKRYHALTLHNRTQVNHLPFMPFPASWPAFIPKDKLAGWLEAYAQSMELNCWTGTEFASGCYDKNKDRWTISLRRKDGSIRIVHPRHVVMATGVSGIPNWPDIPTLQNFRGRVVHASQYEDSEALDGQKAIVIGTGNSGHDIAQDLYSAGASVTLVQRSPTLIVNIEPSAQLPYALYDEGSTVEDCDLIAASIPLKLSRKSHQAFTRKASNLDKRLLDGLVRRGFKLDFGEDGTGWQFKYLSRGGGYYFNVGCSDLIVEGKIRLEQWSSIDSFVPDGAKLNCGGTLNADLIVLATGYKGQEHLVRKLLGDDVADTVGPIWGFGDNDELRNMYTRTGQTGLWFIAGSLAQCRIYSKYLGLQIKASELGVISGA